MTAARVEDLPRAFDGPAGRARLRSVADDFRVVEQSRIEPSGTGEHAWLRVRKRGENTADVAAQLARHAGVPLRDVGYAGLKDRQAVTEQWFSVLLAGRPEPDWTALNGAALEVLQQARHGRKLQRGTLAGNSFTLTLRAFDGDRAQLDTILQSIAARGVPNYFTEQRFGRGDANLRRAEALFAGTSRRLSRHQRGLALSAARALLFNRVLAARVAAARWDRAVPGDAMQLDGSHSWFLAEAIDAETEARLAAFDIHPTGPLCGRGDTAVTGASLDVERGALADAGDYLDGLDAAGLRHDRRALRVRPADLAWQWQDDDVLVLSFGLPPGSYATAVLRELVEYGV